MASVYQSYTLLGSGSLIYSAIGWTYPITNNGVNATFTHQFDIVTRAPLPPTVLLLGTGLLGLMGLGQNSGAVIGMISGKEVFMLLQFNPGEKHGFDCSNG